jgi:hypothetical protein
MTDAVTTGRPLGAAMRGLSGPLAGAGSRSGLAGEVDLPDAAEAS